MARLKCISHIPCCQDTDHDQKLAAVYQRLGHWINPGSRMPMSNQPLGTPGEHLWALAVCHWLALPCSADMLPGHILLAESIEYKEQVELW